MKKILLGLFVIFLLTSCSDSVKEIEMNGQSMYPTYQQDDIISYTLVNKEIKNGDIVVVNYNDKFHLKRVIGTPGDIINIRDGKVYRKSQPEQSFEKLDEEYLASEMQDNTFMKVTGSIIGLDDKDNIFNIPDGEYFLMGDNRKGSTDSRACFSNCSVEGSKNTISLNQIEGIVITKN